MTQIADNAPVSLSIIRGIPLSEDPDMGALTIGGYLREVTERFAGREAVVMPDSGGTVRWSYTDLWNEAVKMARCLIAHGVVKGTRVGLLMTNRLEFVSSFFGTVLAGGVAVPLSTFSTAPELRHLLKASACSVLLLESKVLKKDFISMLAELDPALLNGEPGKVQSMTFPFLKTLVAVDGTTSRGSIESWPDFVASADSVPAALVDLTAESVAPCDLGAIFFSSGSTALPKGIQSAHRAVALQLARWSRLFGLDSDTRVWTANGMFWSGTFGCTIGSALSAGGVVVLQKTFDPEQALQLMESERVNFPLSWPHQWAQLADAKNWDSVDLSAMRYVNPNTPIARHPTVTTDWDEPVHSYGSSETFTISAIYPSGTPKEITLNSAGTPLPGIVIKIVDPLTGETLPMGERGEIAVKGPTLMLGYVGIPLDETLDEEGFFLSGDGGYVDAQNRLFWEGRLNDIIKTGGANVSPVEVDLALKEMPGVKVGQVVGLPHDTLGEIVVACIVTNDGVTLSEDDIKAFLKQRLASYKVPRLVLFFTGQEMKKTGSAKIKTADLRELASKRLEAVGAGQDAG